MEPKGRVTISTSIENYMATIYRPHFRRLFSLVVTAFAAFSAAAQAHDHYKVIELGALGASLSYANCVNDSGVVVGNVQYADGHLQAFVWDATNGIRRVDPTTKQSIANCINGMGVIAGAAVDQDGFVAATIWPMIGQRNCIAYGPFGAVATSINDNNAAVGYREDGVFDIIDRAFSWPSSDPNSAWDELFGLFHDSFATNINNRGQIVGVVDRQAFVIDPNGKMRILAGDPMAGAPASAVAINDKGNVLVSQLGNGFLFKGGSRVTLKYGAPVFPEGLNDRDEVVGYVDNGSRDAFVWDRSSGVQLLNDLIDTPGWQIFDARSINKSGMIAGFGVKNGRRRAVLLVPVKAPDLKATQYP